MIRRNLGRYETKVIDAKAGRVEAIVSSEEQDRQGDIIRQAGWDLGPFQKHPVLVSSHDYFDLRSQIGEWEDMKVKGKRLVGTARYYVGEGNAQADWGFTLAQKGRAAFSVGFIPDMEKAKALDEKKGLFGNFEFNGQELLEVSQVVVPANRDGLQAVRSIKSLRPEIAEIVDETLKDMDEPVSVTLAASFDPQTEALIEAIGKAIARHVQLFDDRTLRQVAEAVESQLRATGLVGSLPPAGGAPSSQRATGDGSTPADFDHRAFVEALHAGFKESLL